MTTIFPVALLMTHHTILLWWRECAWPYEHGNASIKRRSVGLFKTLFLHAVHFMHVKGSTREDWGMFFKTFLSVLVDVLLLLSFFLVLFSDLFYLRAIFSAFLYSLPNANLFPSGLNNDDTTKQTLFVTIQHHVLLSHTVTNHSDFSCNFLSLRQMRWGVY